MNKTIEFIKKHKLEIYAILVTIAVILLLGVSLSKCSSDAGIPATPINWEQKYDSLSESIIKNKISSIKIIENNQVSKNNIRKKSLVQLKYTANKKEIEARSDVKFIASCDSALNAKNRVIEKQDTIIRGDSVIYSLLLSEISQKDSLNSVVVISRNRAYEKIDQLNLSNQRTFIEKNGIFVGGIGAVILGAFAKFILF